MFQINWGDITPEQFLKEYWQKKPLLIKGGFSSFKDPISADELAGLAMEEEIESRIIKHNSFADWKVQHGPFEDFSEWGEDSWTLLVQAVNNWSANTQQLLKPFKFVPNWRIDDVMVSFSTPQGGVGAHLDQYDVFIIQGEGKRHWQVGLPDNTLEQLIPHPDLKQVSTFKPIIDEITESGDILYIPPNHPHNGVAIENALNFSVGFQAPNSQELISCFADTIIDKNIGENRIDDADREVTSAPEFLELNDIAKIKQFMLSEFEDETLFNDMLAKFLTRSHHTLELLIPVDPFTTSAIENFLKDDEIYFRPVLGIKSLISKYNNRLYINGESFQIEEETTELARQLATGDALTSKTLQSSMHCLKNHQLFTNILNMGYWYVD